ncbi:hypothetical protein WICPIJ_000080 [Wickerhamomyces pijperi]|uniref:Uncharacterized protein n=1 Tax=Wickerhamomyces pijperi TaxID=599730 RepID=A0A9P8QD95_WICPI|nr:hypothetical protein WICPIJ_000080 [Wickerhamomyces pijperi]
MPKKIQRPEKPAPAPPALQPGSAISDLGPSSVKEPTSDSPTTKAELVRKADIDKHNYKKNQKTNYKELRRKLSKEQFDNKVKEEQTRRKKNYDAKGNENKNANDKYEEEDVQQLEANRN